MGTQSQAIFAETRILSLGPSIHMVMQNTCKSSSGTSTHSWPLEETHTPHDTHTSHTWRAG